MAAAQISEALAPGLDLFAAAWLEEWTRNGGFVSALPDGQRGVGFPMDPQGPEYPEPRPDLCEQSRQYTQTFNNAHYSGRMRAMISMLDAVPYAREALYCHMASHGMAAYVGPSGPEQ